MIIIGEREITLRDFDRILFEEEKIEIAKKALQKLENNHKFLQDFSKDKVIYGINTSFGPMAQYRISDKDIVQLQYNLIRSHSSGSGNPLPNICVKACMIARLNTLLQAKSGVHPDVIKLLTELINRDIYPLIPEHGGVGASGDLVQLSHLALALIGEGEVYHQGGFKPTAEVLKMYNLSPIPVKLREGLALINGTSCMSGIGIINTLHLRNLVNWSIAATSIINELVESYDDHFSAPLNDAKQHPGQKAVAAAMRNLLAESKRIKKRPEHLFDRTVEVDVIKEKVQEYYSLRCAPQVIGPILETLENAEKVLEREVNSVNDNPVISDEFQNVFHGGNFHGDYISFEMDKIKIATTKLSMLMERQLNYLLNDKINNLLPPFVNLGTIGLNLGVQGMQFTATSTTAENQTLSNPMYIHSIPNNNDNQDIVSMGTNAALIARKVVMNTFEVTSVHYIAILQAIEYLTCANELTPKNKEIYDKLRTIVPKFVNDTPKYEDIQNLRDYIFVNRIAIL